MRNTIPKSRICFTCGAENPIGLNLDYYYEEGKVYADFIPGKEYGTSETILHPGIALAALIEVMGWVPAYHFRQLSAPIGLNVKMSKPIPIGYRIRVSAEPVSINKWLSEVKGIIEDDNKNKYYEATGKYVIVSSNDATVNDHFNYSPDFYLK